MFKLSRWLRSSKQQVLPTTTDLELQNEDGRNASDLPRQDHPFDTSLTCPSNHSALNAAVSKVRKTVNKKRLPNCIFLCIGSKSYGPHVIRVPCRRSSKLSDTDVPDSPIKDDQDVATFQRLREAYFVSQGRWKKWLPFYDAVEVREINFSFTDVADRNGRARVGLEHLKLDEIKQKAQRELDRYRLSSFEIELGDFCDGEWHASDCPGVIPTDDNNKCPRVREDEATKRLHNLTQLGAWLDCTRDPGKAQGRGMLGGMAQCSPIYHAYLAMPRKYREVTHREQMRGLYVRFGWQLGSLERVVPAVATGIWLSVAVVWLGTLLWAEERGDWSTAMGFGQLLAASVALLFVCARD